MATYAPVDPSSAKAPWTTPNSGISGGSVGVGLGLTVGVGTSVGVGGTSVGVGVLDGVGELVGIGVGDGRVIFRVRFPDEFMVPFVFPTRIPSVANADAAPPFGH